MLPDPLAVVPLPVVPEVLPLADGAALPDALPLTEGEVVLPEPAEAPALPDVLPLTEGEVPLPLVDGIEVLELPDAPPDVLPGPAVGAMPPGDTVLPAGGQSFELLPGVPPDGALEPEPLVLEPLEL